ncbi:MAG: hypothetical protein ACLUD2_01165 [Clostridium sp.]
MVDEFHRLIRPQVYTQMHHAISEVTHMDMKELRNSGELFPDAAADFLSWCGGDAVFCTWGNMDLLELQRNMDYYHMDNPFPKPLFYYDVQKLYGLFCRENARISLTLPWKSKVFWKTGRFTAPLDDASLHRKASHHAWPRARPGYHPAISVRRLLPASCR